MMKNKEIRKGKNEKKIFKLKHREEE